MTRNPRALAVLTVTFLAALVGFGFVQPALAGDPPSEGVVGMVLGVYAVAGVAAAAVLGSLALYLARTGRHVARRQGS